MKQLATLLEGLDVTFVFGEARTAIASICADSRTVTEGALFVALNGTRTDGNAYIDEAVKKGAVAVVVTDLPYKIYRGVCYVLVKDVPTAFGRIAARFHDDPSRKLKVVGITGTNGKTTIATLLFKLFTAAGNKCGLIGTVGNQIGDITYPATHTTPSADVLQALFAKMVEAGCTYIFMECSSHAIVQGRTAGTLFSGGVFSNITPEHLDYHKTFDAYVNAKKQFFDQLPSTAFALVNTDDANGARMTADTSAKRKTFKLGHGEADFAGELLANDKDGMLLRINGHTAKYQLIGGYNAYNLLAVYGAAVSLGMTETDVQAILPTLTGAKGRFEQIKNGKGPLCIVDYAHTPDALENVLATVGAMKQAGQKLICVVGCGGDRDKTKRPVMAKIACDLSDLAVFTSDNPRTEAIEDILDDMLVGVESYPKEKWTRVPDRKQAIARAVKLAGKEGIVLVAGKGHENYQEINGARFRFDDSEVLSELLMSEESSTSELTQHP